MISGVPEFLIHLGMACLIAFFFGGMVMASWMARNTMPYNLPPAPPPPGPPPAPSHIRWSVPMTSPYESHGDKLTTK